MLNIKDVTAQILIGDKYKADLMELIRNKMISSLDVQDKRYLHEEVKTCLRTE